MENPLSHIDGDLLREQRLFLLQLSHDTVDDKEDEYLDGLINFLDVIADYCHDEFGNDCLLREDVKPEKPCDTCGSALCHG